MPRRVALLGLAVALVTASCSAGFSKPRAETLVEFDSRVFVFVDPDPNRNTAETVARIQVTSDGRAWEDAERISADVEGLREQIGQDGVTRECDEATGSCYRVTAPDGGLRLEQSTDGGDSWNEVWSISAGRIEFQDRCCGARTVGIRDLEYVPETGLVAIALGEYGLLTRGTDGEIRLDTFGRPDRPESGLMTGLYMEPLFAAVLALAVGWLVTEQRLHRMRGELEIQFGSDGHTWLTSRARQVPIMLPFALFLAMGGVIGLVARLAQTLNGDPPQASGWLAAAIALVAVLGVSFASERLHRRQWRADEATAARAPFIAARKKAVKAHAVGAVSAVLTLCAGLAPFVLWSTGAIDAHRTALLTGLGAGALIAAGFMIWEATNPPLPD